MLKLCLPNSKELRARFTSIFRGVVCYRLWLREMQADSQQLRLMLRANAWLKIVVRIQS